MIAIINGLGMRDASYAFIVFTAFFYGLILLVNILDFKTSKKIIIGENVISGPNHRLSKRQTIRLDEIQKVSRDGFRPYDEILCIQDKEGNEINITLPLKNQKFFVESISRKVGSDNMLLVALKNRAT